VCSSDLAGVGGQGVLLASEVLAETAALAGLAVKKSEVHGMAQRGGSVVSHLRFGPEVFSPLIPAGEADFLVSFEELEALRYLPHLRAGALALVNRQRILHLPVSTGRLAYPADVAGILARAGVRHAFIDGVGLAREAGNERAVNAVVIGGLANHLPFGADLWEEALRRLLPERLLAVNRRAFALGREAPSGPGAR
jgi:indolepyruvate ferredoxin oxidoreductase beta subunit